MECNMSSIKEILKKRKEKISRWEKGEPALFFFADFPCDSYERLIFQSEEMGFDNFPMASIPNPEWIFFMEKLVGCPGGVFGGKTGFFSRGMRSLHSVSV